MGTNRMKKHYITLIVSLPISLIFIMVIASQYTALVYTKYYNDLIQNELFKAQIGYSQQFTTAVSYQLGLELQKIPHYIRTLNQYFSKIVNGNVLFNEQHVSSMVHMEMLYQGKVDPKIIEMFNRSSLLINCWFHTNYTSIDQLDDIGKYKLKMLDRYHVLSRAMQFSGTVIDGWSSKSLKINDFLETYQYQALYAISGVNSTLKNAPRCPSGSGVDPRCRFWYEGTSDQETVQIFQPSLIYVTQQPSLSSLACQRMMVLDQATNQQDLESVICLELRFNHTQNYFQNFASSTKQIYFVEPNSQILLYNSNQDLGVTQFETLQGEELEYLQSQSDAITFNNTLKKYYGNQLFLKANSIDSTVTKQMDDFSQIFSYSRNGSDTVVIMAPVFVFDKLPQLEGIPIPINNEKFQVKIPYVQINIISNEDLRKQGQQLEDFFNKFYLYFNICFGIYGFISIFFITYYCKRIRDMFGNSIDHLTDILSKMNDQQLSQDIFDMIEEENFLSSETLELYQSFKSIYQILLYSSENYFSENETEKLLKLNRNIKFFQQFGNNQAVGITLNNIGSILLSQGHYFQALEHFSTSILYARYEIQEFCTRHPNTISASILSEFCFTKIKEMRTTENQMTSKNRLFSLKKISSLFYQIPKDQDLENSKSNEGQKQTEILINQERTTQKTFHTKKFRESIYDKRNLSYVDQNQHSELTEDRIQLLSNLFYRKRNYITTLLAFQENYDLCRSQQNVNNQIKTYDFWLEIKKLTKKLLMISKLLPQSEFLEIEINIFLSKCYFKLNKEQKSKQLLNSCKSALVSLSTMLQRQDSDMMNSSFRNKPQFSFNEKSKYYDVKGFQFAKRDPSKDDDSSYRMVQRSPLLQCANFSTKSKHLSQTNDFLKEEDDCNKSIMNIQNSMVNPLVSQSPFFNMRNNRANTFMKTYQYTENNQRHTNQRLTFSNQQSPSKRLINIQSTTNKKNIECIFQSKRKLISDSGEQKFLNNYLSKESLELIMNFTEAEFLISQSQYFKAALILTELLEEKKSIMSHYHFKIVDQLRLIFQKTQQQSKALSQFIEKFCPEIKMQIQMIFDCNQDNNAILKSIQLASNVVSGTLVKEHDQFGVILADKSDNCVQKFMTLMKASQIKTVMGNILEDILLRISKSSISELIEQLIDIDVEQDSFLVDLIKQSKHKGSNGVQTFNFEAEIQEKYLNEERSENLITDISYLQKSETTIPIFNIHFNVSKTPILKQPVGDDLISNHPLTLSSTQIIEESNMDLKNHSANPQRDSQFQQFITSSLLELYEKSFKYQMASHSQSYRNEEDILNSLANSTPRHSLINKQYKFILYCTDSVQILCNENFKRLCNILLQWNIKLMIYSSSRGNNFLEQQPDLIYAYKRHNIIRVFYSQKKILNYLDNCRNKFSKTVFPTIIQYF